MKKVMHLLAAAAFLLCIPLATVQAAPDSRYNACEWCSGLPDSSQNNDRDHAISQQLEANLRSASHLQATGDLADARNRAIRAWIGAGIAHSIPTTFGSLNPVLLFPERDALHFFAWNTATELVYIDISGKAVKLAWRASLKPRVEASSSIEVKAPYAFVREEALVSEDGVRPAITKPLVYFEMEYNTFGGLLYGRVTQSGDFVSLGIEPRTWHHYDGANVGGVTTVGGRWVAWPTVCSIPGEHNGFSHPEQQLSGPIAVSRAARALAVQAHEYMKSGNLAAARNTALEAWKKAGIAGSIVGNGDGLREAYVFPEGEGLRFFNWNFGNRITYIEIRGDSVALVWAADLVGSDRRFVVSRQDQQMIPWPTNLMPRVPYKFASGSAIMREVGRRPNIRGALVYFVNDVGGGDLEYGRIEADGSLRSAGTIPWPNGRGPSRFNLPSVPDEPIIGPGARP